MPEFLTNFRDVLPGDEAQLAGRVSAGLWIAGGATLLAIRFFPGMPRQHHALVGAIAIVVLLCGSASAFLDWRRASAWWPHLSSALAVAVVTFTVWASGGAESAAWVYFFFAALFASYFYPPPVAILYLVLCGLFAGAPLVYDARATEGKFLAQWLLACSSFAALGGAIMYGKHTTALHRSRAELLAAEQGALRRVATAVVRDEGEERIHQLAVEEAAALLGADGAGLMRWIGPSRATVVASWSNGRVTHLDAGLELDILPGGDLERAAADGPICNRVLPPDAIAHELGHVTSLVAPIVVDQQLWGILAVGSATAGQFDDSDKPRIVSFCDLIAAAIANLDDRSALEIQALTDSLTGVANQRELRRRLDEEVARSLRHERPLSVALLDVDHFKQINDTGGHDAGDQALIQVAACLKSLARTEDTIGRLGGDEFMWILPDTRHDEALVAVERARQLVSTDLMFPFPTTISAGIAGTDATVEPGELVRLADVALYWSKARGRNQVRIYAGEQRGERSLS